MHVATCKVCCSSSARRLFSASARRRSTNVLDSLKERGLVQEVTSSALRKHLESPRTLYLGCDPTAPSLHLGNLIGLLALLHFQVHGHRAIALIGGATGSVGDPSGRSSERTALSPDALANNIASIEAQIKRLFKRGIPFAARRLGTQAKEGSIEFKDNAEWTAKMSLLDFLSGPGKRARVGVMLARDSVKNRLNTTGISFTEFSYQLLQAYDFYHLHRNEHCTIQLGGSDQWGNIQSGIEMIRREALSQAELAKDDDAADTPNETTEETQPAYGLTWPLLTTAKGEKFGKSAGNAIWLDESLTSPFEFYQFFLRTQDEDVARYLHIFTFLDKKRIKSIMNDHNMAPEKRKAQRCLAQEVTELVHGPEALGRSETATRILFQYNPISTFSANVILDAFKGTPHHILISKKEVIRQPLASVLLRIGLASSRAQAKAAIASKAVAVNGKKVLHANTLVEESELLEGRVMIFGHGKSGLRVVEVKQD